MSATNHAGGLVMPSYGNVRDSDGSVSANVKLLTAGAFTGITTLCVLELIFLLFFKFKKRMGIYFWSVCIAAMGVLVSDIGTILAFFTSRSTPAAAATSTSFSAIGVLLYVLPEYVVIYSRLHLLYASRTALRFVLFLGTAQYIFVTIPTVASWIAVRNFPSPTMIKLGGTLAKINVFTYMTIEIVFSSIYIWHTVRMWGRYSDSNTRRILAHLVCINSILIALHGGSTVLGWMLGIATALSNTFLANYFLHDAT
jgi:hypothetical protein